MRLNEVAVAIHRRMCEDDRFGYSWEERYGALPEVWEIGRKKHRVNRIETLGNGQVPLCAAIAFVFGFEILEVATETERKAA